MPGVVRSAVLCLGLAAIAGAQTPVVQDGGVLNAASFVASQPIAAGSLVSIFGSELAAGLQVADSIPLSTTMGNVSVTFNDVPAPILFVSQSQINAQVPWEVQTASARVVVKRGDALSAARQAVMGPFSPGIFSTQFGTGQAIAINSATGLLAAAAGAIPGLTTEPVRPGGVIIVYANGLGAVTPAPKTGSSSTDALRNTNTMPEVLIGGKAAQVAFSGLAPQFVGVNQLNIVIPDGVTGDTLPLQLRVGGITTSDKVTIAVR